MRKLLTLTMLMVTVTLCYSQESPKEKSGAKVGLSFASFGENPVVRTQELMGSASYNKDNFYAFGVNYLAPIKKWLSFETGVEYLKHSIIVQPNLPPDMDRTPYKANISLINVPVTLRVNFLKYLFVNGGLLLDLDASGNSVVDSQTGVGTVFGVGAQYDFKFGGSLFVNSYYKTHSKLPFIGDENAQHLLESGVKIGVYYNL